MPATISSLEIARRQTILRLELGEVQQVVTDLTALIDSVDVSSDPRLVQSLYYLYQDRATVLKRANRWEEALADVAAAEKLLPRLSGLVQPIGRIAVAHARALLLSDPFNPRADETQALRQIEIARSAGAPSYLVDDFKSRLAFRSGRWQEASASARVAAEALEAQGWLAAGATGRRRAGEALIESGDLTGAEEELRQARAQAQQTGNPNDVAHAELAWARLLSARGEHDAAWQDAQTALERFDFLIHDFRTLEDQQRFLVDKLDRYADAFEIALRKDGREGCLRAWSVAERAKSFYLSQLLASAHVDLLGDSDSDARAALRAAEAQLDEAHLALAALTAADRETARGRELAAKIEEASNQKKSLFHRLMQANPRWGRVSAPTSIDMEQTIATLPGNWCLLSYYWGRTGFGDRKQQQTRTLHLFWSDGSRQPRHTTTTWTETQVRLLETARSRLRAAVPRDSLVVPPVLRDQLLPCEVCDSIPEDSRVLISPHGLLQLLPLHAVQFADGSYAAGHWGMQYVPTLALLSLARDRTAPADVLAIGCPVTPFGGGRLTYVEQELQQIGAAWSATGDHVACVVIPPDGSPDASGVSVESWGKYRVLHVACHGEFPEGRPFDAALLLGSEAVRASEFFALTLQADIACFSACAVGRHAERVSDEPVVGDEWIGLYLPLLYGGAGCVIASLWDADSELAALFMTHLHRALAGGKTPAEAMLWAQDAIGGWPGRWANWYPVGLP